MLNKRYIALLTSTALTAFVALDGNAQQIILDGRTNTRLDAVNPTTTSVTTTTISGGNGINSFKRFGVDAGNTVNLIQPSGTKSLINIITGNKVTNISGILNAYKDGRIGGNSIIANTNGIVISKGGVVNAGRLTLTTPSREFTDSFFDLDGNINSAALQALTIGSEQLNPNSDIRVSGRIDAEALAIRSGRDIKVDGVIHSRFGNMTYAVDKPNSAGKKTVKTQSATGLSVSSNGVVRLFAGRNAQVSGKIKAKRSLASAAPSTNNVSGGEVYLYAEQNLTLDQHALIDVSGTGTGDAGLALLFGNADAVLSNGALVTANAESGNAGFIEFSASKSLNLAGDLTASSQSGTNGTIFIDPEDLTISTSYSSNGANLLFIADKTITVDDGITLNTNGGALTLAVGTGLEVIGASFNADDTTGDATLRNATIKRDLNGKIIRTGDGVSITLGENTVLSSRKLGAGSDIATGSSIGASGDITLYAPEITVKSGAGIYAHVTGSHRGGKISFNALKEQLRAYNTTDTSRAFVHINSATFKAREIDISAEAFATNLSERRDLSGVKVFPFPDGFPPSFPTPPSVPSVPTPEVPDIPNLVFDDFGPKFKVDARSEVIIENSTLITSSAIAGVKDINIVSNAVTDVVINPNFRIFGGLSFQELAGLSLGVSETHTKVDIKSSALTSANSIKISSNANEIQELETTIKQNDGSDAIALNLSLRDLTNQVLLHPNTSLNASKDISINAVTTKDIQLSSAAEVQPHSSNRKLTALASNLSIGGNLTEVVVAADLNASGNVNIAAKTIYDNYIGKASALIANVASRQNSSNTTDSDVLAAQAGIRKYVSELALRLFDINLNENQLLSKVVVTGVEKGIQNFSFAGALDISEEQDKTIARIGTQYTDLTNAARPTATFAGPVNPIEFTATNIDIKSLMSYGEVDANDAAKGVIITGQAIQKRAEATYKYSGGAASQQDARLLDATISKFTGETHTEVAGNAVLRATGKIDINANVQYPRFNSSEFRGDLDEYLKDALPEPTPVDGGYQVKEPTLPANPLEDYFTTFARAKGTTAKNGYALNGTYFSAANNVGATIRSGAYLNASGDINIATAHQQQTLHVTNLPFSSGSAATGIGGSFSFNLLTSNVATTIENGAIVVANNISASALNTGTTFNNSYSHGQSQKNSVNGALASSTIDNDTLVDIGETAKLTATDKIVINATDDLGVWTIGGGVGRSQKTGVGIGSGKNTINRTTSASIGNRDTTQALLGVAGTTYFTSRLLDIDAKNSGKTVAAAAGWGSAGASSGAAVAGSLANNDYGIVEAVVGIRSLGEFNIGSGGINIDAIADIQTRIFAGAIGINGTSTLAGAVANFDTLKFDTRISIDDVTLTSGAGINVDAIHNAKVFQLAGGGAVKGNYTGAGSLVISEVNGTVSAEVTNASLTATAIGINALDNSEIKGAAGVITYSKKFGFGTSIVHNTLAMVTKAKTNNTNIATPGAFNISAKNTADIRANAVAGAVSQGSTGSASITINNIGNSIKAAVINGTISATGGISIRADKETIIKSKSGAVSAAKNTAVGAAAAINAVYDDVSADLETSNLSTNGALLVSAINKADISTTAVSGALGTNGAAASIAYSRIGQLYEPTVVGGRIDQNGKAENNNDVSDKALQLAESAYGKARDSAVNLRFNVGLVSPTPTDGTAAGLILQQNGATTGTLAAGTVSVKATDESKIETLSGGIGAASKLGGGAAFSINNYGGMTLAYLRNQGANNISLTGGMAVLAEGKANISAKAASLAGAGNAGIAGSATINLLNGTALADIRGIAGGSADKLTISGGTIKLSATQTGTFESFAGAVGAGGKAGIAGAVAINYMSNDAIAEIADITFDTDNNIDVDAKISAGINTQAVSAGGAGTGSFSASVAVNTMDSSILAQASNAVLKTDDSITFDAENKTSLDVITGAAAVAGTAAIGASISVNDVAGSAKALATSTNFTAGSLSFDAYSDADMSAKAAAGTFATTLAINAAFSRNDLKTEVLSSSTGGSINATGDVNFTTQNLGSNDALLVSVAAAKGALGASVAIANNEAVLFAGMNGTNITNAANITVKSDDKSTINAKGYGVAAGGIGASGVIIEAKNSAQIFAIIEGASDITSTGNLLVNATTDSKIETDQIAVGAGFAGAGMAVSTAENETKVKAHIRGSGNVEANNVSVITFDKAGIISDGYAISATGTGGAGTDITARNSADVDSSIDFGRGLTLAGNVDVTADTFSTINATQASVAISGSVGVGIALSTAENKANTDAKIGATSITAANITVAATDIADVDASGFALAAGTIGAGAAADVLAYNNATVISAIGDNSAVTATGALSVTSTSTGTADANTGQISVGAVALGFSRAIARSNNMISTSIGNGAVLNARGNISIGSKMTATNVAGSFAVAGGLVGVGGAFAEALDDYQVNTNIGNSNINSSAGNVIIDANTTTTTRATASGVSAGLVALGTIKAFAGQKAISTVSQTTVVGGAEVRAAAGTMSLAGTTTKTQTADVISGAGGVGSSTSGEARTRARSKTGVDIVDSTSARKTQFSSDYLRINSNLNVSHWARVNNVNASVIGRSGGKAINDTIGISQVIIGQNAQMAARHVDIKAKNDVRQAGVGDNVLSRSGGAFDAAAAEATTNINNVTNVFVKDGVAIEQYFAPSSVGGFNLGIENSIYGRLTTTLDSGGAIAIAKAEASFTASQNNNVEIGNVTLFSAGNMLIYNRSDADIEVKARSTTYGASGSAQASSNASFDSIDTITIGNGADIEGVEGVNIAVGNSASGDASIRVSADTRLYNRTLIPVSTKPSSNARVNATRKIDIQNGSLISSANDVSIFSNKAKNSVSEYGLGKDLWQEIFEELFGGILDLFFGIDLSLEVRSDVNPVDTSTSTLNIEGIILAGNRSEQYLTIDGNGTIVSQSDGITYNLRTGVSFVVEAQTRVDDLNTDIAWLEANNFQGINDGEILGLTAERDLRQTQITEYELAGSPTGTYLDLGDIRVDEGNIIINAANIVAGTTGKLQANGKSVVKIDVLENYYINTGNIIFGSKEGGRVSINNVAVNDAAQFGALNSASAQAGFTITVPTAAENTISELSIKNRYSTRPEFGPDIILNGIINNARGSILLRTEQGNIDSRAEVTGLTLLAEAPNGGFIQTYKPGVFSALGSPQLTFRDTVLDGNERRANARLPIGLDSVSGNFSLYTYDLETGAVIMKPDPVSGTQVPVLDNVRQVNKNTSYVSNPDYTTAPSTLDFKESIFITSEYINVNGIIKSGGGLFDLNISDQLTQARLDNYFATSQALSVGREVIYSTDSSFIGINGSGSNLVTGNVILFYDHDTGRLVADEATTSAGRITLAGNIISTGRGLISAFDGFGEINISNNSNFDLQLDAISTGRGATGVEGLITITDTGKARVNLDPVNLPRGEFLTTTYRFINGKTTISDNDRNNANVVEIASSTHKYQPTLDRQYVYYEDRDVTIKNTVTFDEYSSGTPANTDDLVSNTANFSAGSFSKSGRVRIEQRNGTIINKYSMFSNGIQLKTRNLTSNGASPIETKVVQTFSNPSYQIKSTVPIAGDNRVTYVDTSTKSQLVQHSFKADYPIVTEFIGANAPGVNITSTGTGKIIFGDSVINGGPTNISAQASIVSASDQVRIASGNATISALGSISGHGNSPLNFELADNAILNVIARDNINIRQFASTFNVNGNLKIAKAHHTGNLSLDANSLSGNVTIRAEGSITGTGSQANHVKGVNVSLTSDNGSINAGATPLRIATGQGLNARFNAVATKDINFLQASGDLQIDVIESRTGNVRIDVASGQILDANIRETADTQTITALTKTWKELGLLDDGTGNVADRLISERNAQYAQYWGKRGDSTAVQTFVLTADERTSFYTVSERKELIDRGLTDAQVESRIDAYISDTQGLYDIWNSQSFYDTTYSYALGATELADSRAEWELSQLQFGVPNTLELDATDTTTAIEDPNIKAEGSITIIRSGAIGTFTPDLVIATGANDLFDGPNAQENYLSLLTAEEGDVRRVGDTLFVRRADDVDVTASGNIIANATIAGGSTGNIFLGSEKDLAIERITAAGEVRITTSGAIEDVAPDTSGTINAIGKIVLESAKDSIGTDTRAVTVRTNDIVTARAGKDIFIQIDGNLNVGRINADNLVSLTSHFGSILDGFNDNKVNVRGFAFNLNAAQDIGAALNPLEILQDAGAGVLRLHAKNAFIVSENDLKIERLNVGSGVAELEFLAGSLEFTPQNGEAGLKAATAKISLPGVITDDENDNLAIDVSDLTIVAGGTGSLSPIGVENRLNINVDTAELSASGTDAVFRLDELDGALFGTSGLPLIREIHLGTGGDLALNVLEASHIINLNHIAGDLLSGTIKADYVAIDTAGSIGSVAPIDITANRLDLAARTVDLDITDPDPTSPLLLKLRGGGGKLAERMDVRVKTAGAVEINELRVVRGDISTTGSRLTLKNGTIAENVWFRQANTDLYVTNKERFVGLSDQADIQAITDNSGSVEFNLRNETKLAYSPDILHHRMPILTLDSVGDFSITAYEVISSRSGESPFSGRTTRISIFGIDGAVIGNFIIRFPIGPSEEIDPEDFILSEKFQSYVKANFGGSATVKVFVDANQNQEISLAN